MIRAVFVLAVLASVGGLAEEPAWGKPVDGLKIGVTAKEDGKAAPGWVAVYASTDEKGVAIPAAFPRQAVLRVSATSVCRGGNGLTEESLAASAPALSADKAAAALSLEAKGSFECTAPAVLTFAPLKSISTTVSFRAETPDDQPEAQGWQDIAESDTLALRRTKTGWAPAKDEKGGEAKRDDWATAEEIWSEFLARKPEFLEALKNADWNIRREAVHALALQEADAKDAVPSIAALLGQEDPTEERAAHQEVVAALGVLAKYEPSAIAPMVKVLGEIPNEARQVRLVAVKALAGLKPSAPQIEGLATALKDPWSAVRCEAALSLGKLGPEAKAALPALQEAAKDTLGVVHEAAQEAIRVIQK
jgi:hypothetical protein